MNKKIRKASHPWLKGWIALTLCFIWGNSLLPATYSSVLSEWVRQWLNFLLGQGGNHTAEITGVGLLRKLAHATEFAVLGLELGWGGRLWRWTARQKVLLYGLLTALTDETIQLFVEGRAGQIRDVWIDFSGFCVGYGVFLLLQSILRIEYRKTGGKHGK